MQVIFTFNDQALWKTRTIELAIPQKSPYVIPKKDPRYTLVRSFQQICQARGGFHFNFISLIHATAIKKLGYRADVPRFLSRSFLVSGALYLALNPRHPDLEIRQFLGDFTASYSHDFGVGLTVLVAYEMFDVSPDNLNPIKVDNKKPTLDYATILKQSGTMLCIEAKGVTSDRSRSNARGDITKKKKATTTTVELQDGTTLTSLDVIKLGVIAQAALSKPPSSPTSQTKKSKSNQSQKGVVEIIDPTPDLPSTLLTPSDFIAGKYWHFAGVALFAGLDEIAREFALRARALEKHMQRDIRLKNFRFDNDMILYRNDRALVGIQWQLSDLPQGSLDIWFYQAADREILQDILQNERFPSNHIPYSSDLHNAESLLPDGSYFGIGLHTQEGLTVLEFNDSHHDF